MKRLHHTVWILLLCSTCRAFQATEDTNYPILAGQDSQIHSPSTDESYEEKTYKDFSIYNPSSDFLPITSNYSKNQLLQREKNRKPRNLKSKTKIKPTAKIAKLFKRKNFTNNITNNRVNKTLNHRNQFRKRIFPFNLFLGTSKPIYTKPQVMPRTKQQFITYSRGNRGKSLINSHLLPPNSEIPKLVQSLPLQIRSPVNANFGFKIPSKDNFINVNPLFHKYPTKANTNYMKHQKTNLNSGNILAHTYPIKSSIPLNNQPKDIFTNLQESLHSISSSNQANFNNPWFNNFPPTVTPHPTTKVFASVEELPMRNLKKLIVDDNGNLIQETFKNENILLNSQINSPSKEQESSFFIDEHGNVVKTTLIPRDSIEDTNILTKEFNDKNSNITVHSQIVLSNQNKLPKSTHSQVLAGPNFIENFMSITPLGNQNSLRHSQGAIEETVDLSTIANMIRSEDLIDNELSVFTTLREIIRGIGSHPSYLLLPNEPPRNLLNEQFRQSRTGLGKSKNFMLLFSDANDNQIPSGIEYSIIIPDGFSNSILTQNRHNSHFKLGNGQENQFNNFRNLDILSLFSSSPHSQRPHRRININDDMEIRVNDALNFLEYSLGDINGESRNILEERFRGSQSDMVHLDTPIYVWRPGYQQGFGIRFLDKMHFIIPTQSTSHSNTVRKSRKIHESTSNSNNIHINSESMTEFFTTKTPGEKFTVNDVKRGDNRNNNQVKVHTSSLLPSDESSKISDLINSIELNLQKDLESTMKISDSTPSPPYEISSINYISPYEIDDLLLQLNELINENDGKAIDELFSAYSNLSDISTSNEFSVNRKTENYPSNMNMENSQLNLNNNGMFSPRDAILYMNNEEFTKSSLINRNDVISPSQGKQFRSAPNGVPGFGYDLDTSIPSQKIRLTTSRANDVSSDPKGTIASINNHLSTSSIPSDEIGETWTLEESLHFAESKGSMDKMSTGISRLLNILNNSTNQRENFNLHNHRETIPNQNLAKSIFRNESNIQNASKDHKKTSPDEEVNLEINTNNFVNSKASGYSTQIPNQQSSVLHLIPYSEKARNWQDNNVNYINNRGKSLDHNNTGEHEMVSKDQMNKLMTQLENKPISNDGFILISDDSKSETPVVQIRDKILTSSFSGMIGVDLDKIARDSRKEEYPSFGSKNSEKSRKGRGDRRKGINRRGRKGRGKPRRRYDKARERNSSEDSL